jgi:hypothetical protein
MLGVPFVFSSQAGIVCHLQLLCKRITCEMSNEANMAHGVESLSVRQNPFVEKCFLLRIVVLVCWEEAVDRITCDNRRLKMLDGFPPIDLSVPSVQSPIVVAMEHDTKSFVMI